LTAEPAVQDWDVQGSAYPILNERCGLILSHAEQAVDAILSSPQESGVFGISNLSLVC
jgi:GntR family transcriptional regulator